MAQTIWKMYVPITDRTKITVPGFSMILRFPPDTDQNIAPTGTLFIWVLCDPSSSELTEVELIIVGTGNPVPNDIGEFLGTVRNGEFVWHIFRKAAWV